MSIDESEPTEKSLIAWKEGKASCSLSTFLQDNAPSKTRRRPGGDGWIWVNSAKGEGENRKNRPTRESLHEARTILEQLVERMKDIEKNAAIPKVKSRTSGPTKKMLKDTCIQKCEQELRNIGVKNWPSGKWMFFERAENVDLVFGRLAQSIIDGPLSKLKNARCHTIKVATADSLRVDKSRPERGSQQLICLYFEDIWNKKDATEVLECIVKEHGQIPNSAKADLYTMINLDSNHPSKIRSTLYRPAELFTWEQLREWQSAFFELLKMKKVKDNTNKDIEKSAGTSGNDQPASPSKKRKFGLEDGDRVPVNPEQFWPSPGSKVKDAFTTQRNESRSNSTIHPSKSNAQQVQDDDDSQTESESEPEAFKAARTIQAGTPPQQTTTENNNNVKSAGQSSDLSTPIRTSNTLPIRTNSSPAEPFARNSTSPKEKPKETPIVVFKANRKRDRFGRSDF